MAKTLLILIAIAFLFALSAWDALIFAPDFPEAIQTIEGDR